MIRPSHVIAPLAAAAVIAVFSWTALPAPVEIRIDLDAAQALALPAIEKDLVPAAFEATHGRRGWALRLPGGRPIATPAFADGVFFVGGGYGSHEFYAIEAATGKVLWEHKTADDGPTAAVVEDGLVAFNTESCTVIVLEAATGKLVWQEWLGDPLMSQPAISNGKLYMAYPKSKEGGGHYLLCADLRTGRHLWETRITGDVITAPIVEDGRLVFTCFDGTSFCLDAGDGTVRWKKENQGTSAPLVVGSQVIVAEKAKLAGGQVVEGLRFAQVDSGVPQGELLAAADAKHLTLAGNAGLALSSEQQTMLDGSVGFGGGAPAAASLNNNSVGVATVAGAWAFQGAKASYAGGRVLNAQGNDLNCVDHVTGAVQWRARAQGAGVAAGVQSFAPPALGKERMFVASALGHLVSLDRETGGVRFMYATGKPMAFQPALAGGRMVVGTNDGMVLCLETGDADADGWTAWGGNAQHNRKP